MCTILSLLDYCHGRSLRYIGKFCSAIMVLKGKETYILGSKEKIKPLIASERVAVSM